MQRLARETGGAYFQVSKDNSIEKIYASIEEQLRNQYSIGYVPEQKNAGARYRPIRLTTNSPACSFKRAPDTTPNKMSREDPARANHRLGGMLFAPDIKGALFG
jgi:hypothetical protein